MVALSLIWPEDFSTWPESSENQTHSAAQCSAQQGDEESRNHFNLCQDEHLKDRAAADCT